MFYPVELNDIFAARLHRTESTRSPWKAFQGKPHPLSHGEHLYAMDNCTKSRTSDYRRFVGDTDDNLHRSYDIHKQADPDNHTGVPG